MSDLRYHVCERNERFALHDARGIFCAYVCDKCEDAKRSTYRADIFTDGDYWTDEPVYDD